MKFSTTAVNKTAEILYNDHYVAIPYDCTALASLATDSIIPAGTLIPSNDAQAKGVLLHDVDLAENPNGTIVIHGFIKKSKLPAAPASTVALAQVMFMD